MTRNCIGTKAIHQSLKIVLRQFLAVAPVDGFRSFLYRCTSARR